MRGIATVALLASLTALWLAACAAPHRPVVSTPEAYGAAEWAARTARGPGR